MKKYLLMALLAFLLSGYAEKAAAAEDILYIRMNYIVSQSKAGKSLQKQAEKFNNEIVELRDEIQNSLTKKGEELNENKAILSPEVYQEREDELRKEIQDRSNELNLKAQKIQQDVQVAEQSIMSVMNPILTEIINEKGANILLERTTMLAVNPKLDVSAEVIKELNNRLPKVDVIVDED